MNFVQFFKAKRNEEFSGQSDVPRHHQISRSSEQMAATALQQNGDRVTDLLDFNSEPAVEDLTRQIMSQAKFAEAIQEATRDIQNRVGKESSYSRFPVAFNAQ